MFLKSASKAGLYLSTATGAVLRHFHSDARGSGTKLKGLWACECKYEEVFDKIQWLSNFFEHVT